MPFLHVTTKIEGRKHDGLLSDKGGDVFPTFIFMDPRGGVLLRQAGVVDMARLGVLAEKAAKRREAFVALKAKADAGDEKAKAKLAVWDVELLLTTLDEFRKAYPDLEKLDEELRFTVYDLWAEDAYRKASIEFAKIAGRDESKFAEAAKVAAPMLLEVARTGAEPAAERDRLTYFLILGMGGDALDNKEMLKLAVEALEDDVESNKLVAKHYPGWQKKLAAPDGS